LKEFAECGFEHIRRKGYTRVITHAGTEICASMEADTRLPRR
jgi:hypothetical protein